MASIHSNAKSILVGAFQDATVAAAAGLSTPAWASRVLSGDRDGYIAELHRGRLPAVEIYQEPGERWTALGDVTKGIVAVTWRIRVHVGGVDQTVAEHQARMILYTALTALRAEDYFTIGDDVVQTFTATTLGHQLEATINTTLTMDRTTYELTPESANEPPTSEGDMGGISYVINYNDTSPIFVLDLPVEHALDTISIKTVVAFDGASPTVSVGVAGDTDRYILTTDVDLTEADVVVERDANEGGPREVYVYLDPGSGASQGQIEIQISVTNAA